MSSPILPETKMKGMSRSDRCQIPSAAMPLNPGIVKSERITWGRKASSSRVKPASVWTRRLSNSTAARFSSPRISSASRSESSTSRTRSPLTAARETSSAGPLSAWRRRLIDDGPEHAGASDGVDELLETHRLHHVGIDAQLIAFHEVRLLARGGQHHHRDHLQLGIGLDIAQHFEPVLLRHLQVEQYHDGKAFGPRLEFGAPAKEVQGLVAVTRHRDRVGEIVLLQRGEHQLDIVEAVFHQENWPELRHAVSSVSGSVK